MRKAQRIRGSCEYNGLVDGSLLRNTRRHITDRNIHQIIFRGDQYEINNEARTHASDGFLIGIVGYGANIHSNHAVSALLIQGRLYLFNAHGDLSLPMDWFVNFLRNYGFTVNNFIQYSGPNLQALDTRGVCTAFASRFLNLHPNMGMNQTDFNDYVVRSLSKFTIPELYKYIEGVASIRNVGSSSNNNRNNNRNRKRKNVPRNMNINRPPRPTRMNIN